MKKQRPFHILEEKLVRRQDLAHEDRAADRGGPNSDDASDENPYWAWEELPPHPNPELGCIRRGLCCKSSPGWFAPGEAEKAAAALGMEPDAFVREYLVIDYVDIPVAAPSVDDEGPPATERVYAFAPVKLALDGRPAIPPATRTDSFYQVLRGQCVFFRADIGDGAAGCKIYETRPFECRRYICTNAPEDNPTHVEIGLLWRGAASEKT